MCRRLTYHSYHVCRTVVCIEGIEPQLGAVLSSGKFCQDEGRGKTVLASTKSCLKVLSICNCTSGLSTKLLHVDLGAARGLQHCLTHIVKHILLLAGVQQLDVTIIEDSQFD